MWQSLSFHTCANNEGNPDILIFEFKLTDIFKFYVL
jgi:hypothetical protein